MLVCSLHCTGEAGHQGGEAAQSPVGRARGAPPQCFCSSPSWLHWA